MTSTYVAFRGSTLLAQGDLATLLRALLDQPERGEGALIYDERTGGLLDVDFQGTAEEVVARAMPPVDEPTHPGSDDARGRGRPKLGVVSREVSLLPRQWAWLEAQPRGISAALRRLIDDARREQRHADHARVAREAVHKLMTAVAGDLPGYEEAIRSLYAGDGPRFFSFVAAWPEGVRSTVTRLSLPSFAAPEPPAPVRTENP